MRKIGASACRHDVAAGSAMLRDAPCSESRISNECGDNTSTGMSPRL
jgi:hypothetical protein